MSLFSKLSRGLIDITSTSDGRTSRTEARKKGPRARRLLHEPLEQRQLLSLSGPADDAVPWGNLSTETASQDPQQGQAPIVIPADAMAFATPIDLVEPGQTDVGGLLETSGPLIGLNTLRSDPRFVGITGDGYGGSGRIGVAILDTGIDVDHGSLRYAGGYDFVNNDSNPDDDAGHGTHVSGIVGSTNGTYKGVAPGVNLYGVKVLDASGGGYFYQVESGLQWVISNAAQYNIKAVNMSLGNWTNYREGGVSGALDNEIATLESMGVSVVAAAGNDYYYYGSVSPAPGQSYPGVNSTLGVGAVWTKDFGGAGWGSGAIDYTTGADRIVSFSQRDPDNSNHVMAPGAIVTSTARGGGFTDMSGTSMASPHVAGLVALVQDAALEFGGRALTAAEVTNVIRSSATTMYDGDNEDDNVANTYRNYLRVNAYAAVEAVYDMFNGGGGGSGGAVVADANGPYEINEGQGVTLNASGSTASAAATYEWDVDGDGDFSENVRGKVVSLTWPELQDLGLDDGWHENDVTVRVTDPSGGGGNVIVNGGFETGNLSGWNSVGSASVVTLSFGSGPTEGTYEALLTNGSGSVTDSQLESFLGLAPGTLDGLGNGYATEGSALKQTFTAQAGDVLRFDWNFLTDEDTPSSYNDFAFVSIAATSELADTGSTFVISPTPYYYKETGFQTFTFTFPSSGTYRLGVGVVDVGDSIVDSALLIDDVYLTASSDGAGPLKIFWYDDYEESAYSGSIREYLDSKGHTVTYQADTAAGRYVNLSAEYSNYDVVVAEHTCGSYTLTGLQQWLQAGKGYVALNNYAMYTDLQDTYIRGLLNVTQDGLPPGESVSNDWSTSSLYWKDGSHPIANYPNSGFDVGGITTDQYRDHVAITGGTNVLEYAPGQAALVVGEGYEGAGRVAFLGTNFHGVSRTDPETRKLVENMIVWAAGGGGGGVDTDTTTLTINNVAPAVTPPVTQTASEGSANSFTLGSFADPGDDDPWVVTVAWGDLTTSSFNVGSAGSLGSLTHTYADNGTYTVTVTVAEDSGAGATGSASFQVNVANVAPVVTSPVNQTSTEGSATSFGLGSFTDPGDDDPWKVTVAWGDTTTSSFNVSSPGSLGSLTHTYADNGTYTVTVTVAEDNGTGATGSASFQVNVANVAPTLSGVAAASPINENDAALLTGAYTDPGLLDRHALVVQWDDPNSAADSTFNIDPTRDLSVDDTFNSTTDAAVLTITSVNTTTGAVGFSVQHRYLDDGLAPGNGTPSDVSTIAVTVTDGGGGGTGSLIGLVANDGDESVTVFDPTSYAILGTVALAPGLDTVGDVAMTADGRLGFVTDFERGIWVIDATASPPRLASGANPIRISNYGEDLSITADQKYLVVSDGGAVQPLSVVDIASRAEISTFSLSEAFNSVEVSANGSVLATSYSSGNLRRLTIDAAGNLSNTGEAVFTGGSGFEYAPNNVILPPGGQSVVVVTRATRQIRSYRVPGLVPVDTRNLAGTGYGLSGLVNPAGDRIYVRKSDGRIDAFTYNPMTAQLGASPLLSIAGPSGPTFYGMDQMAISPDGSKLYVSHGAGVNVYDANTGALLGSITDSRTRGSSGIAIGGTSGGGGGGGGGGSDTETIALTVNNVPPTLSDLSATPIMENGTTTLSGTIADVGTLDTFKVEIDWDNNGAVDETHTGLSAGMFSYTHRYMDDNPSGTPIDNMPISVKVTDDDTGSLTRSTTVQVSNVAPTLTGLAATPIMENGETTLSGTIADVGTLDTFTVKIDWDADGTVDETYTDVSAGTFSYTHQYLDDDPTGTPVDNMPIQVTVTDDDTGRVTGATTVEVTNVAPTLTGLAATPIFENGETTLSGTIADVGALDTFKVEIDWDADGTADETYTGLSAGTFSFAHQYLDDNPSGTPVDNMPISVKVTDDDTGSVTGRTTVQVANVAPQITRFETDSPYCGGAAENETVTATLDFVDPGTLDAHKVVIDWGDGNSDTLWPEVSTRGLQPTHSYAAGGVYQVTVAVGDDDDPASPATASTTVVVSGVGVVGNTLYVVGTPGDDLVTINQTGSGTIKVHTNFLADSPRNVNPAGVAQINVILCWGNDQATIAGSITLPAIMDGGNGNDKLNGGGGGNVLLGGDGNDDLLGGSRGDILIGGAGLDRLVGNPGEDVLIGGRSGLASDPASGRLASDAALLEFLADWNDSSLSRPARKDALAALVESLTDDGDKDVLTGSSGEDWFFAGVGDVVTDLAAGKKK